MTLADWRYGKRAWHCWVVLLSTALLAPLPVKGFDANNDSKLAPPTQEQTEMALEAGRKFREQQITSTPASSAATVIPESYSAEMKLYPASPPAQEGYDDYRWLWGPRVFWPCERLDPLHRYLIYPWGDRRHERDRDTGLELLDMWCPPFYDHFSGHRDHGGKP